VVDDEGVEPRDRRVVQRVRDLVGGPSQGNEGALAKVLEVSALVYLAHKLYRGLWRTMAWSKSIVVMRRPCLFTSRRAQIPPSSGGPAHMGR